MNLVRLSVSLIFFESLVGLAACSLSQSNPPIPARQSSPYQDLDSIPDETIVHIPTGVELTKDQMMQLLSPARIVYIGEMHTNLLHHRIQLDVIKALEERYPGRLAVGMEMFARNAQPKLDEWSGGALDEKSFAKLWYENWEQDLDYYKPIFDFIREKKIPLIGLNASREEIHALSTLGLDEFLEQSDLSKESYDLDDPYHRASMEAVFGGHGHGSDQFDRFYRTMILWDETMAQTTVNYLNSEQGRDKIMVILSGGFHVHYGFGIPRRVFRRLPDRYMILLPHTSKLPENRRNLIMEGVTPPDLPLYIADFVWATSYEDLIDQKVRLGVQIENSDEGVLVQSVSLKSSADQAGVLVGDIITYFADKPILEPFDLIYLIRQSQKGEEKTLQIVRDNQTIELKVKF